VKFAKDNKIDCSCHFSENSSLVVQFLACGSINV